MSRGAPVVVIAGIGGCSFVLASAVVSLRLLLLASRTRELPEFLIGLGLLLMGGLGYPIATAARMLGDGSELRTWLFATQALFTLAGQSGVVLFTWHVFRRDDAWARALAIAFISSMAVLFVWQTASPGWRELSLNDLGPWTWSQYHSMTALGWAGLESLYFHMKLRKRLSLGLADAVTADRLRLWAIAMFSAFTISMVASFLRGIGVPMTTEVMGLLVGPLGVAAASATWLAFMPPHRYVRWIEARAGARA